MKRIGMKACGLAALLAAVSALADGGVSLNGAWSLSYFGSSCMTVGGFPPHKFA